MYFRHQNMCFRECPVRLLPKPRAKSTMTTTRVNSPGECRETTHDVYSSLAGHSDPCMVGNLSHEKFSVTLDYTGTKDYSSWCSYHQGSSRCNCIVLQRSNGWPLHNTNLVPCNTNWLSLASRTRTTHHTRGQDGKQKIQDGFYSIESYSTALPSNISPNPSRANP